MQRSAKDRSTLPVDGPGRWTRIGVPFTFGVTLLGIFIYLIIGISDGPEQASRDQRPVPPPPTLTPEVVTQRIPPPEKTLMDPPPRVLGEGLDRWEFENVPEGFDPALALRIAQFFKDMELPDVQDNAQLKRLMETREELRSFLATLGPEAIPTLSAILGVELDFVNRRFLIYALGDMGGKSEESTLALMDFYEKIREDPAALSEVGHVIKAIGNLKNHSSYDLITSEIDNEANPPGHRDRFIKALGEHPRRAESVPRMVEIMDGDKDVNCRNHAAQFLGKTADPSTLDYLIARFYREKVYFVRQTILGSIGKLGNPDALPFLNEVAQTEESRIRLSAGRAIWRIGTPKAIDTLKYLARSEHSETNSKHFEKWTETPPPRS